MGRVGVIAGGVLSLLSLLCGEFTRQHVFIGTWTRQNPFGFEGRLIFFHIVAVGENREGD